MPTKTTKSVAQTKTEAATDPAETPATPALKPAKATDRLSAMLAAGVHFGQQTRRWNPKMRPYIYTAKNNIHIIDLVQTEQLLNVALKFVEDLAKRGGIILFVGTKRQARNIISSIATEARMPYVSERWLGGTLTNFATISGRVKHLKRLEQQKADGDLAHMTKKEQLLIDREIADLNRVLGGIKHMSKLPDAIFVVDVPRETIAIAEARKLGLPIIAMVDTNADPDLVDWPIPANDDAIRAIKLITEEVAKATTAGRSEYDAKTAANAAEAADNAEEVK